MTQVECGLTSKSLWYTGNADGSIGQERGLIKARSDHLEDRDKERKIKTVIA